jgi:Predicted permease
MKFFNNEKYNTVSAYVLLIVIFTISCIVVFINFDTVSGWSDIFFEACKPLIYAFFFAFFLSPLMKFCDKKLLFFIGRKKPKPKLKKILSVILTYAIALGAVTFFIFIIIPNIVDSYYELQSKIEGYIVYAQNWIEDMIGTSDFFAEQYAKVIDSLQDLISDSYRLFNDISPHIINFISSTINETTSILLGMIFSIYFILSKDIVRAQCKKMLRAFMSENAYNYSLKVFSLINTTFSEYIVGKALDSIFIGLLCFILMTITTLPYASLVSIIVGVLSFIPFFGIYIGALPGIFIIFIASPIKALWFFIMIIGLQQLDSNLIEPRILSEKNGLSALWVLVAIILMSGLLGFAGLFLGVPLFTVAYVLFKELIEKKLSAKNMPTDTKDYYVT